VAGSGKTIVASIGQHAMLRLWDLVTAEPEGSYPVGTAPLIALRFVRLPGDRTVIVLLGDDGRLHIWDMLTASVTRTFSTVPRWRRLIGLRVGAPTLRLLRPGNDEQRYLLVSGRGIATSLWDLAEGRRISQLPQHVVPERVSLAELVDGTTAISRPAPSCRTSAAASRSPGCARSSTRSAGRIWRTSSCPEDPPSWRPGFTGGEAK
jgi:WD40 repeat protein